MRKYNFILKKLLLAFFIVGTVSCEMRNELSNPVSGHTNEEMKGGFSLDLLSKEGETRSAHVVDGYAVQIVNTKGEVIREYPSYSGLRGENSIIELPVGTYTVRSASYKGGEDEIRLNTPYYSGEKLFVVDAGKVTVVKDTCKLKSVEVNVNLDKSFLNEVKDNYAIILTNGVGVLTMSREVNGVIFFRVSPSVCIVVRATTRNGTEVYKSQYMAGKDGTPLKSEDKIDITLGLKDTVPVNPGIPTEPENPEKPDSGANFDITIDVTLNGKDVEIIIPGPDVPKPDPEPSYAVPTIVGDGFNIANTLTDPTQVRVNIGAEAGIENLIVTIDSEPLNDGLLDEIGLGNIFDLAHPGNKETIISSLGLPVGDNVLGKTTVLFDVSGFMEILKALGEEGPHKFHLKVVDKQGRELSKTLSVMFTF